MTRLKFTSVFMPLAALVLLTSIASGMDKEFYVSTYRQIGKTASMGQRAAAMGHTGAGIADGAASLAINPAGLGAFVGYAVEGGVGFNWLDDGVDDVTQGTFRVGGALSLESWKPSGRCNQAVGAQVDYSKFSGATDASIKHENTGLTLGYGVHVMPDLVVGASAALYDTKFEAGAGNLPFDRKSTGGEFKVGGIYRLSDQMTAGGVFGFSTGSYNEKAAYAVGSGSGDLTRWNIQAGLGYQICDETLLAGDFWYDNLRTELKNNILDERNKAWGLSLGIEQQVLPDTMVLRGGLYYDHTSYNANGIVSMFTDGNNFSKGRVGFTAGAAIKLYSFDLGYSLDVSTKGDIKNLLDISAEW